MSNLAKRAKGAVEQLSGKIQKKVGHALGDAVMENNGADQELSGKGRQEIAKAGERAKGAAEKLKGVIRQAVNK